MTLTVLSDKECYQMTKSNTDLSYRAMVTRELCAAKKTILTLRVFSDKRSPSSSSSEQEPGYSVIGSRQHFLWGGSDACQVTSDDPHNVSCSLLTRGTRGARCTYWPGTRLCSSGWSTGARGAPDTTLWERQHQCILKTYHFKGHILHGLDQWEFCTGSL